MLLLWFLEVDKSVRKKPETEAKQNRAETDKQKQTIKKINKACKIMYVY